MTPEELAKIAKGLTAAQREVLRLFPESWIAGPDLPDAILAEIQGLRDCGAVERKFGDMGPPEKDETIDGFYAHIRACWWFNLTPLGLAIRNYLQEQDGAN